MSRQIKATIKNRKLNFGTAKRAAIWIFFILLALKMMFCLGVLCNLFKD
ncbi:hypothetical protein [Pedobacter metabolipauper]|uniref:Uncharacterized protein n=1 Tax=Pedobacter metabolipauper TaxID=425513 RepID=A0A4R6T1H5_9SPHI|nr:hypothetical protein [Pedobacter metabolipauper]TDQ11191.1 hypothetical protein ATK78_0307 [Pedobacter metabolipauper]